MKPRSGISNAKIIEEGYRERGLSRDEAERRAWATVNKVHGGGENPAGRVRQARESRADEERRARGNDASAHLNSRGAGSAFTDPGAPAAVGV
jgi:hypothetical protein